MLFCIDKSLRTRPDIVPSIRPTKPPEKKGKLFSLITVDSPDVTKAINGPKKAEIP